MKRSEETENSRDFLLIGDQAQALAEEVGAALVNYEIMGPQRFGHAVAVSDMSPADWKSYFRSSFGAESAAEEGVVLGDFMFKDTTRHKRAGDELIVTVRDAEVEQYLKNAFGPEVTLAAIGAHSENGTVIFEEPADESLKVVEAEDPWREISVRPDTPIEIRYRYVPSPDTDGSAVLLKLQAQEDTDSAYGCYITAYSVQPETEL